MNGLQISIILLTITLAVTIFFWVTSIVSAVTADTRLVQKRIEDSITGKKESIFEGVKGKKTGKQKMFMTTGSSSQATKRFMDVVFNELMAADIAMQPEEFVLIWLIALTVPAGIAALFSSNPLPPIALIVIAAVVPIVMIRSKKKKRTRTFDNQLSDALMVICNCLRSGLTFQQAMENIAQEMTGPIAVEFSRACKEIRYGASLEEALNNMVARVRSADLLITVSAVNIQRQTGGNLSEILGTIAETIKDRLRIKNEIRSITAQGRTSGTVIGSLPLIMTGLLMIISNSYMMPMFTNSTGRAMLLAAAGLEIIGFWAINKTVTIEY